MAYGICAIIPISGLFALEYAALFDVVNPGLARLGLPVPLGGTSNHFRTEALRDVNGWDAWNVTEDIDLGIRLARFGYRVAMLPSSTFEEAPHTATAWLKQRRRWHKGWMVTLQTHSHDLDRLFGDLGLIATMATFALLSGTIASSLLGPLFVLGVVLDAVFGPLLAPQTPWQLAGSVLALLLILTGAASLLWPIVLGIRRRRLSDQIPRVALLPVYLGLLSFATWQALFELLYRPYSWAKTEHGTAKQRRRPI